MESSDAPKWRRIGAEVKKLRSQARMSQGQLADAIRLSQSMVSAIERGRKPANPDHLEAIDRLFSTGGRLVRIAASLQSSAYPEWFQNMVALEREAVEIKEALTGIIPGLIQTHEYARSLFYIGAPWLSEEEIEQLTEIRLRRAQIFDGPSRPVVHFVLDHNALMRETGGRDIMRRQLEHILGLVEQRKITIQVISRSTSSHPSPDGSFRLMSFEDRPTVAHVDHMLGGVIIGDESEIRKCAIVFGMLQAEAMSARDSIKLIRERIGELSDDHR